MTNLNQLAENLLGLPSKIKQVQLEILDETAEFQVVQDKIKTVESKLKTEINNAVDANGKKVYSNEDARRAAFIEDAANNLELTDLNSVLADKQRSLQEKKIAYDELVDTQRNIRVLINFFTNPQNLEN
jgi:hypothetical protein